LAAENPLNLAMDNVVKRYSSLFKLPSYRSVLLLLASLCLVAGVLFATAFYSMPEGLVVGAALGFSLFLVTLAFDRAISTLVMGQDLIYNSRRTSALSVFCWVIWVFLISIGFVLSMFFGKLWQIRLCLLGFSATLILRLIVFTSTSFKKYARLWAASVLQPLPCAILFSTFGPVTGYLQAFLFIVLSLLAGSLSSSLFTSLLQRSGEQSLGIPSLGLFKAFLLNWIVDLNLPFEESLEALGKEQDIQISMIRFDDPNPKAIIVVPSVHPGPFKNIGSSLLPSILKFSLEKELNCVACVPHGLLGHEFDLASQFQNHKLVQRIVESSHLEDSETSDAGATPCVRVSDGLATACCQIFNKCALLSLTLAPKTTEDLPHELGTFVQKEAERNGLTSCAIVNAHNSIDGTVTEEQALGSLRRVASECLERAASLRRLPFTIGASTVFPKEFSLEDGFGPGGITVIFVKVREQKTAYVVIDGNNMVSGLRERILTALRNLGIDDGEVYTTDTHAVNAVVMTRRGYHPIGELVDDERLIEYVKAASHEAMSSQARAKAVCLNMTVPGIKVIGEKKLETLCLLIETTIGKAKKAVVPIFAATGLLLMTFLLYT